MHLVTLTFPVKSEHLEKFLSWHGTSIKTTQRFSGCLDVEVHIENKNSSSCSNNKEIVRVLTLQTWADIDSHKEYLKYREATGYQSTYAKFLSGRKAELTIFDRIEKKNLPNDETEFYK